jgi:hypothetical protein
VDSSVRSDLVVGPSAASRVERRQQLGQMLVLNGGVYEELAHGHVARAVGHGAVAVLGVQVALGL